MKNTLLALSLAPLLAGCVSETHRVESMNPATVPAKPAVAAMPATLPTGTTYGEPSAANTAAPVVVATLLADPEAYTGKPVKIVGKVSEVCAKKGCWLRMAADGTSDPLFVKFTCPIDGRLIPADAVGKPAVVEGNLVITDISEAQARHYAQDAGKSPAEIAAIVGPQKQITVASPSAVIAN